MILIISAELLLFIFGMNTLSAVRTFIAAEGTWAKSEKDAIYHLREYSRFHDEKEYVTFLDDLNVPLASIKAQIELEKKNSDLNIARQLLTDSHIHPKDIDGLIKLYRRFQNVYYFDKAENILLRKGKITPKLLIIGQQLHQQIISTFPSEEEMIKMDNQVKEIRDQLSQLAEDFSNALAEDSRTVSRLILQLLLILITTVGLSGMLFTISLSRTIIRGLDELNRVALLVTKGDYSAKAKVFSQNEIGSVATAINGMTEQLVQKIQQIKQSELAAKESEAQFSDIFENTSELIQSIRISDQKVLYENPAWLKTLEYTEEEAKNLFFQNIIHPDNLQHCSVIFEEIRKGENIENIDVEFITKSGKKVYVEGSSSSYVKGGVPYSTRGIFRNVTQRKKAEERQAILASIVDSSDDAIISTTPDGTINSWNDGAKKLFGYSSEEILGKSLFILIPSEHFNEQHELLEKIKKGKYIEHYETERKKKDGSIVPVSITLSPIKNAAGIISGISKIAHDITDRKIAEERFRLVTESSPNALVLVNKEGEMLLVNSQTENIFGYKRIELLNQKIEMLIPERFRKKHIDLFRGYFDSPESRMMKGRPDIYGLRKNGTEVPLEIGLSPITTKEGTQVLATIVDITESKRAAEELKRTNDFLNAILENIPIMIFVKDAKDLKFVRVNKAVEDLFGYTRAEIIGKSDYQLFPKDEADFFVSNDKKLLESGAIMEIGEEPAQTKYKGIRIIETTIVLIKDTKGQPAYILGITDDITERKKMMAELDNKTKELGRSNTELEQFAYVASHDLQEPLRMITSYLQLLENRYKDKLDQDAKDFIGFAVDGSNRMKALIQSLLEYSRINRIKPFEEIDVNLLVKDVLGNLSASIKESNAIIKADDLPKIHGDPILIGQVFQNLIENALKFKSTRTPEIIISGKKQNDEFLFSVKDNGIGIQKEYIGKLFVIFQRLHTKEKYPGTGMGLAICKKIVERYGGRIWVESEVDKGSTFYFTIKEKNE